jgi:hypothetical protein
MDFYNELFKKKEVTSIPDFCKHPEFYQTKYDFLKDTILKPRAVYDFFRKAKLKNEGISRCASAKSSERADDDAITDFMYQQVKSGEDFGPFATEIALLMVLLYVDLVKSCTASFHWNSIRMQLLRFLEN